MRTSYSRPSRIAVGAIIAIGILIPTLLASTLVLGLQGPAPAGTAEQSTTTTAAKFTSSSNQSAAIPPGPCEGAVKYAGLDSPAPAHNATLAFPILAVPVDGEAQLCVTYADSEPTANVTLDLANGTVAGTFGTKLYPNGTLTHPFMSAQGITVTSNMTVIKLGGGSPAVAFVAFTIRTNATRGFYFLNVAGIAPDACSDEFRLAVGYTFAAANASGSYFPIPAGFGACNPSGGQVSAAVYAVKDITVVPLSCGILTCDLNETQ
jgi:hypothetical protein